MRFLLLSNYACLPSKAGGSPFFISVDYTVNLPNSQCVESVNFSLSRNTDLIDRTACLTVFSDQESNKDIENNII